MNRHSTLSAARLKAEMQPPLHAANQPDVGEAPRQANRSSSAVSPFPPSNVAADLTLRAGPNGEAAATDLPNLPAWANTDEAIRLLKLILAEQPERSRITTVTADGAAASFGYRGKAANQLRQLYDRFFLERLDWVAQCEFRSREWVNRRNSLIAYDKRHGPDALIERLMVEVRS